MKISEILNEGVENLNGIQLSLEIQKDDEYVDDEDTENQVVFVKATANGKQLGYVIFSIDHDSQGQILNPQDLEVDERFRGQGIAKTMYDYVKSKGYRIRRSGQQTDAGAGFWDKHKPGKNIWEQGVAEGQLNEFAPGNGGDDGEEDALLKYAKMWYQGDLKTQQQVEQILDRAGWEIGELESEEGGCFVMRSDDENSYIGFSAEDLQ